MDTHRHRHSILSEPEQILYYKYMNTLKNSNFDGISPLLEWWNTDMRHCFPHLDRACFKNEACPLTCSTMKRHLLFKEPSLISDGGQRAMIRVGTWRKKKSASVLNTCQAELNFAAIKVKDKSLGPAPASEVYFQSEWQLRKVYNCPTALAFLRWRELSSNN